MIFFFNTWGTWITLAEFKMHLLVTNTSWSFILSEVELPEDLCRWPINLSWRWDSFNSKLPSNSMSGLLPPALARVLWLAQLFGRLFMCTIILLAPAATANKMETFWLIPAPLLSLCSLCCIETRIIKQYDCLFQPLCLISSYNNIWLSQEGDYYARLSVQIIFNTYK